jgi:hypothetical protein
MGIMHKGVNYQNKHRHPGFPHVYLAIGTFMQNQDAISEPRNRNPMESQKSKRVLFFYFLAQTCKTPCPCSKPPLKIPFHPRTNKHNRPSRSPPWLRFQPDSPSVSAHAMSRHFCCAFSRERGCSKRPWWKRGRAGEVVKGGQMECGPRLGLLASSASGALGLTRLEAVLESSGHILEVASSAGTDGLSSLSLLGPVVCEDWSVLHVQKSVEFSISGCRRMFGRVFTYTCGSWQKGNRKKSTHASGCEESGDLLEPHQYFRPFKNRSKLRNPDIPRLSQSFIVVVSFFSFSNILCANRRMPGWRAKRAEELTTSSAQGVRLVVTLTEAGGTLRC